MGQKVTREHRDHSEEQIGSMAWGSTNRYGNVKILHGEARELDGLKGDNHYYSTGLAKIHKVNIDRDVLDPT